MMLIRPFLLGSVRLSSRTNVSHSLMSSSGDTLLSEEESAPVSDVPISALAALNSDE